MLILGIESTCDETACAIVENGTRVVCNVIYSQIAEHIKTGGVVPEVASRKHIEAIIPVLKETLAQAEKKGIKRDMIDAIAVARNPGLLGCLLVGNNTATALSLSMNLPLIPVNHIEGHLYASWLTEDGGQAAAEFDEDFESAKFPILILTVSGGHNNLVLMKNHGVYELLGETLDDSAGEAFDKVARMMGLSYPGGPAIQNLAKDGNTENGFKKGDEKAFKLPKPMSKNEHSSDFNYSFSGLKTAVRTIIIKLKEEARIKFPNYEAEAAKYFNSKLPDLCASFEHTICENLLSKLEKASLICNPKEIHIAGGVSANLRLRSMLEKTFSNSGVIIKYPKIAYCTDNAAMIASVAYFRYIKNPAKYQSNRISIPSVEKDL